MDWIIFRYRADGFPLARIANTFYNHGWPDCITLLACSWVFHKRQANFIRKFCRNGYGYCGVNAMKKILVGLYLAYSIATDTIIWGGALYLLINGGF